MFVEGGTYVQPTRLNYDRPVASRADKTGVMEQAVEKLAEKIVAKFQQCVQR